MPTPKKKTAKAKKVIEPPKQPLTGFEVGRLIDSTAMAMAKEPSFQLKVGLKVVLMFVVVNLTLTVGIGSWLAYQGKQQRERIDLALNSQLSSFQQSISNRIVSEFETARIRETISSVASNQADRIILGEIQPAVTTFKHEVASRLEQAQGALQQVSNIVAFASVLARAQSNDGKAFDELWKWSGDPSYSETKAAHQAVVAIMDAHNVTQFSTWRFNRPWPSGADPKWDTSAILTNYQAMIQSDPHNPGPRIGLQQAVWERSDLTRSNKLAFAVYVMMEDANLNARSWAGYYFRESSGFNQKTLARPFFLDWWLKNAGSIKD